MFPSWWSDHFGQTPPLGYRLRHAFPTRWLRIHSLPGSKRYAEDTHELELLLQRHATIAQEVLGADPCCRMLTATYGEQEVIGTRRTLPDFGSREFECFATMPGDEDEPPVTDVSYWFADAPWDFEAERSVLVEIADDQLCAAWLGQHSKEIFAPYDGGIDLILASSSRRDMLADRYRTWLSARPDGL